MLQSKDQKATVLITGAGGYIGPVLAECLSESGFVVHGLDLNFKSPWSKKFLDHAIESDYSLNAPVHRYDAVVHLGASSLLGPSMTQPHNYFNNNVSKTQQFIQQLGIYGFKGLFINASSAAVYGQPRRLAHLGNWVDNPWLEIYNKNPCNPYGHTKLMVEQLIDMLCSVTDLNAVSLRFFNVAGAGRKTGSSDELPHVLTQLNKAVQKNQVFMVNGDGRMVRDFVHVQVVCNIIKAFIEDFLWSNSKFRDHPKFNVCSGAGTSINELISIYETEANTKVNVEYLRPRPGDPDVLIGRPSLINHRYKDITKTHSLKDIIRSVLAWNITRGELYDYYS